MNGAHAHLLLNHIPLIAIPVVVVFLLYAVAKRDEPTQRFAIKMLLVALLTCIAVFVTGEPAEDVVEGLTGINDKAIHAHEEAGEVALYFSLVSAALAAILLKARNHPKYKAMTQLLVALSLFTVGALGYASYLGGKIHHPEFEMKASVPERQDQE